MLHPTPLTTYLLDVQEICDNYSIIAYYFQRPTMNEKFAQRVTKFNENSIPEEVYKMNRHLEYITVPALFFPECAMVEIQVDAVLQDGHSPFVRMFVDRSTCWRDQSWLICEFGLSLWPSQKPWMLRLRQRIKNLVHYGLPLPFFFLGGNFIAQILWVWMEFTRRWTIWFDTGVADLHPKQRCSSNRWTLNEYASLA